MKIDVKVIEKHNDKRGILLEIFKENGNNESVKQVYYSISSPGVVRGNHYHLRKIEWLSVIKGSARILCEDLVTKQKEEILISDENPAVVKISPFITHAIKNVGQEDMYLLVAASEVFDPTNPDIQQDKLL